MVNKHINDDLLIQGKPERSFSSIKKPDDKQLQLEGKVDILDAFDGVGINKAGIAASGGTLQLLGTVDIVDDGADTASLAINGVDIVDYTHVDTPTIVTATPYNILASDYLITVRVSGGGSLARIWTVNFPSAQALPRKVFKITVEGQVGTDLDKGGRVDMYPFAGEKVGHKDVNFFMVTQHSTYEFHSVENFEGTSAWGWKIASSYQSQVLYNALDRVRVSSVGNETIANVIEGYTVDGKSLLAGDFVLLKDQSTATQNGVYVVNGTDPPDRVYGYHTGANLAGQHLFVHDGTTNANSTFVCTNIPGSGIVDTDNLVFVEQGASPGGADTQVQFNNSGSFGGSSDLTWDGSQLHVAASTASSNSATGAITTLGGLGVGLAVNIADVLRVESVLISSGSGNGSITTLGGVGIAKDLYVGGELHVEDGTQSSNSITGSVTTAGGLGVGLAVNIGDVLRVESVLDSSSVTTGSFTTFGGIGVGKKAYFGGNVNIADSQNLYLGDGNDFGIVHNGSNTILTNSTGGLTINGVANQVLTLGGTTTTGSVTVGGALTTGSINLGNTSSTNKVSVKNGFEMANKGSQTQITTVTTAVTLNNPSGFITTLSQTLASHGSVTFTVNNTFCAVGSGVLATVTSYTGNGSVSVAIGSIASGSFTMKISNASGVALNSSVEIYFMIT